MEFFRDPPNWAYALLIGLVVLPGLAAALFSGDPRRTEKKKGLSPRTGLALISVISLLLLLGLFACDHFLENDRKQIIRKINEMSAGVHERNLNKIFEHVSESFQESGANKQRLRELANRHLIDNGDVTEVKVTQVVVESVSREQKQAVAVFLIKVEGNSIPSNAALFRIKARFVLDPDNQWRLRSFDMFTPEGQGNRVPVPGMG